MVGNGDGAIGGFVTFPDVEELERNGVGVIESGVEFPHFAGVVAFYPYAGQEAPPALFGFPLDFVDAPVGEFCFQVGGGGFRGLRGEADLGQDDVRLLAEVDPRGVGGSDDFFAVFQETGLLLSDPGEDVARELDAEVEVLLPVADGDFAVATEGAVVNFPDGGEEDGVGGGEGVEVEDETMGDAGGELEGVDAAVLGDGKLGADVFIGEEGVATGFGLLVPWAEGGLAEFDEVGKGYQGGEGAGRGQEAEHLVLTAVGHVEVVVGKGGAVEGRIVLGPNADVTEGNGEGGQLAFAHGVDGVGVD